MRIPQADVDQLAEDIMLDYLARPEVVETPRAGEQHDDQELSEVRDQLAAARTRHEELADAVGTGILSMTLAAGAEPVTKVARLDVSAGSATITY